MSIRPGWRAGAGEALELRETRRFASGVLYLGYRVALARVVVPLAGAKNAQW
jgi:hypothetical protein